MNEEVQGCGYTEDATPPNLPDERSERERPHTGAD